MGNSVSRVVGCFVPVSRNQERVGMCFSEPLDEGLGHSFCYIRPPLDSPHFSPGHSDRFNLPFPTDTEAQSSSFRSNNNENIVDRCRVLSETPFKSISGASVSANTSTPRTAVCHEYFHSFTNVPDDRHAAFESTASFASLPLQPVPRNATLSGPISGPLSGPLSGSMDRGFMSGPIERAFMSGPLERGTMSGSLERGYMSGPIEMPVDRSHFSAPLAGYFRRRKRPKAVSRFINSVSKPVKGVLRRSLSKTTSTFVRTQKTLIAPIRKLVWSRLQLGTRQASLYDSPSELGYASSDMDLKEFQNLQWAQGKAGEDRVHVVISEEHGWLFVGIYDGFNGPDAPDFLMRNLYRAIYRELQGLLWDQGADCEPLTEKDGISSEVIANNLLHPLDLIVNTKNVVVKTSSSDEEMASQNIIEQQPDLSGQHSTQRSCGEVAGKVSWEKIQGEPERLTCNENCIQDTDVKVATSSNVDMADDRSASNAQTQSCVDNLARPSLSDTNTRLFTTEKSSNAWSSRSFIRPSFRHRKARNKESHRKMLPQRHDPSNVLLDPDQVLVDEPVVKQWTHGLNNHNDVLKALASALEDTEEAYLDMADQALDENPELALIGSCILVVLMKDKDVYVLNVGDSRAIIAQSRNWPGLEPESCFNSNMDTVGRIGSMRRQDLERIVEESPMDLETFETSKYGCTAGPPPVSLSLRAVQLSTDHDTSIEEETWRIKAEHPDDNLCILNDRVKGRLKVTRAFGAGFLKKPRWNNAILKRFQIDYVGTAPYISCIPALRHYRLGPKDRFLILSSDGLYQYFTNEEVVSHVEWFMEKFPEGDPAQHLIEELLFRAAKKAGMDFHELLDIPQGDRRKYHDDVSVMVISLEGKIWRSSG